MVSVEQVKPSKRIAYIDIAKGIGILLVVAAHNDLALVSPYLHQLIYSFHMPLFFFLSGYFFNPDSSLFVIFRKRFNTILKPYLVTILLIYATSVSFSKMSFSTAIGRIIKSLYGTGYYIDWVQLWFLPHLFAINLFAFLFYWILFGARDNRYVRWAGMIVMLTIGVIFLDNFYPFPLTVFGKDYELYGLPFSLDLVLLSGFFFILGNEIRHLFSEKFFENLILLLTTGIGLLSLNYFLPQQIDFNTRVYESPLLSTFVAILGILFVLALSRQIELRTEWLSSILKYIGKVTLFILIFHVPIQDFWGQKILFVTGNTVFAISTAFLIGVIGPIIIYEIFFASNPVALRLFGRPIPSSKNQKSQAQPESETSSH